MRLLRLTDIIGDKKTGKVALIPVSRSCWLEGVKKGTFPEPSPFGSAGKIKVWRSTEIDKLLAA